MARPCCTRLTRHCRVELHEKAEEHRPAAEQLGAEVWNRSQRREICSGFGRQRLGTSRADAYVQILDDRGFLPSTGFGMVDFTVIPRGLRAQEEEKFVRENGSEICRSGLPLIAKSR
jgi:hypothetical protein